MTEMTPKSLFEYKCPECGTGTVRTTKVLNFKTKIKGYPFVVDEAIIGICDNCQTQHFSPNEVERWERLYYKSLETQHAFFSPKEITNLRKSLGLSMEDFAKLIGCTRQSIFNWEKSDRPSPPSRMADVLFKLLDKSRSNNRVDALSFLLEEAKKLGVLIEVRHSRPEAMFIIHLDVKPIKKTSASEPIQTLALAAESSPQEEEIIVAETSDGKTFGVLTHDFEKAQLLMKMEDAVYNSKLFDIKIKTREGKSLFTEEKLVEKERIVLADKTSLQERDVVEIEIKEHVNPV